MEIIKMFPEDLNKREQFKLMKSPSVNRMQDAEGSVLEVAAWIDYTDADPRTGEIREVLTIKTVDGEMFGTISATFLKEFKEIVDYFGDDVGMIRVITGQSKAGRTFVTCSVE